jgi:hypothetical protein
MTKNNHWLTSLLLVSLLAVTAHPATAAPQAALDTKHRAFLKESCLKCHNADKQKGKVRLDDIPFTLDSVEKADLWQKVLNTINSGEMPPEDEKQPSPAAKTDFLDALSQTLVAARAVLGDSGGKITMRRLNRREYKNTLRDLLGVEIDVRELPADGGAGTFDTVGSSLFMSSDQFEQYLTLGRQALDEHFARHPRRPSNFQTVFRLEPETLANPLLDQWIHNAQETEAKFKPWAAEVDRAAAAPENKEAIEKLKVSDPQVGQAPSKIYYYSDSLKGAPRPQDHGLGDPHNAAFLNQVRLDYFPLYRHFASLPHRQEGAYLMMAHGYMRLDVKPPQPLPPGDYVLRMRVGADPQSTPDRRFIEVGPTDLENDWEITSVWSSHQITGRIDSPQILEVPIRISSDTRQSFSVRERQPRGFDARNLFFYSRKYHTGYGPEPSIWIDWVALEGPLNAPTPTAPTLTKTLKQRREVEHHANAMVGGIYNGYYKGGYEAAQKFMETGTPQKGIPDEPEAKFRIRRFEEEGPTFARYLNDPLTQTGAVLTLFKVHPEEVITLPPDQPSGWLKTQHPVEKTEPGDYLLRFRIGAVKGTPSQRHFVELGSRLGKDEFRLMRTFQISGTPDDPQIIEVPVSVSVNGPRTFVLRERRDVKLDRDLFKEAVKETQLGPPDALWIDWVEWEGPILRPDGPGGIPPILAAGESDARSVLEKFAERAFRGKKHSPAFLDKLTALHDARIQAGEPFEKAIREPLSVILASPGFLYLQETGLGSEPNPGGEAPRKPQPLSRPELASRLSYFLWSAPPDAQLLKADLTKPEVVVSEVTRMIASEKADEFVSGFVHQWLGMDRLDFFQFDTKQFRDFDESAKAAARQEVYETFAHLLRHKGSLSKLLKSDEVHVNGLLAVYYGIEGVRGDAFQKVKLPPDSPRGGLLGMAAVLAMGSNGERTSPVERGAWVLRKLLHSPPPPAPPNVPQITRLEGKLLNTRERLMAHQEEPQCLQCHRKIDAIGFGLENFNAAGKWRTEEIYEKKGAGKKTWPIDPAGQFHNGPAFKDYFELRDLIAAKPESFARGFTEALIEYALGRPYGFTDTVLADDIVAKAKLRNFTMIDFIAALATSREFGRK